MELFPATDEDAWTLITEVIDGCDYYVLILGGKYGSTNPDGFGYTEMEFDYASEIGKPILCFLYENLGELTSSKVESSEIGKERLERFRKKAEEKHCKYWSSAHDLGGKVSRSLIQLKKKHPSDGWVPGRYAADQKMLSEIEQMRTRIVELEYEALTKKDVPPPNYEEFVGGQDSFATSVDLKINAKEDHEETVLRTTWDHLFSYCGPALIGECTSEEFKEKVQLCFWHLVPDKLTESNSYRNVIIRHVTEDQILIQFQALGLMEPGDKKRTVSDTRTYWKLTPFGEKHLIQVRALRRGYNNPMQPTANASVD